MEQLQTKSMYQAGVVALLLSALLTSISQVFYANQVQGVHPFIFTAVSFLLTTIYFQIFAAKRKERADWNRALIPLVKLNVVTAVTFMGYYYALKYVEPAIVTSLEIGVAPLFIVCMMLLSQKRITKMKWFISVGTFIACLILMGGVFTGTSGVNEQLSGQMMIGLVLSVICGIGAIYCSEYSKVLNEIGWSSSMILSKRYYGVILISLLFTYNEIIPYFLDNIVWIVLVTAIGVIVPNYLMQKGIQHTNTFLVMMLLGFIPVFTFICQLFDRRLEFSVVTLAGVLLLSIMGLLSIREERNAVE